MLLLNRYLANTIYSYRLAAEQMYCMRKRIIRMSRNKLTLAGDGILEESGRRRKRAREERRETT